MKTNKILFYLLLTLTSCIKELNYRVDMVPKQLVINSVIAAYDPVRVNVSGLQSILDSSLLFINNASVILEEVGGYTDTLRYESDGNYVSYLVGYPGKVYHLTVRAEGYPTAFATDTVPLLVPINKATQQQSLTVDEDGNPHDDFTLSFSKQPGKTNYYELFFVDQSKSYLDSVYSIYFQSDAVNIDPIILASGITDFNSATFLFSDATIADGEYTISMKMIDAFSDGGTFEDPIITTRDNARAAVLRTVSGAYYNYRCSWEKHKYFKNDITKVASWTQIVMPGEPQEMVSNIENGLGIFVAYNQDVHIFF
jgi:hypothetical protein